MRYFDHDTTASGDDLILALRLEHGGAAVDCYWAILEQIYREESPLVAEANRPETKALCVRLQLPFETLESYVSTMCAIGLLEARDDGCGKRVSLMSRRAEENIAAYREKCETARRNGRKGGGKPKGKANRNQSATKVASGLGGKEKEKKGIGSHKGNQIPSASDGAAAVENTAPPSAQDGEPLCPLCSKPVRAVGRVPGTDRPVWQCETCGDVKEPRFGVVA